MIKTIARCLEVGWAIIAIAWFLYLRPWEGDWYVTLIGLVVLLAIAALLHGADRVATRLGIGEARFNSRTGKTLKPGERNR